MRVLPLEPGGTGSKLSYRPHHAQRSGERDQAGSSHTCLRLIAAGRKLGSFCLRSEGQEASFPIDHITPSARGNATKPAHLTLACVSLPPAGNWVRSACQIPPWFVVSFALSMTSTRANWLRSGAFPSPRFPPLRTHWPLTAGHWPLFSRHSPPATRHSPLATRHSPLATRHQGHWPLFSRRARRKVNMLRKATFSRIFSNFQKTGFDARYWLKKVFGYLSLGVHSQWFRHNGMSSNELRHIQVRSLFFQKSPFYPFFLAFCPDLASYQR